MKLVPLFATVIALTTAGEVRAAPRTLVDMIAAGRYGQVSSDVSKTNFSVKPKRFTHVGVEMIGLDRPMSTKELLADLDRRGYRPASIEELLAYGAKNPEEQRKRPIIALGSSCLDTDGSQLFPYLFEDHGTRELGLIVDYQDNNWGVGYAFLVVRK